MSITWRPLSRHSGTGESAFYRWRYRWRTGERQSLVGEGFGLDSDKPEYQTSLKDIYPRSVCLFSGKTEVGEASFSCLSWGLKMLRSIARWPPKSLSLFSRWQYICPGLTSGSKPVWLHILGASHFFRLPLRKAPSFHFLILSASISCAKACLLYTPVSVVLTCVSEFVVCLWCLCPKAVPSFWLSFINWIEKSLAVKSSPSLESLAH